MAATVLFYAALLSGFLPWSLLCLRKKTFVFRSVPIAPYLFYILVATLYELMATQIFHINTSYWFQLSVLLEIIVLLYFFTKITKPDLLIFVNAIFFCSVHCICCKFFLLG